MKYSLLSIDSSLRKYFSLNDKTGDLSLSATDILDREVVCQFHVTCVIDLQIVIQSTHTQFFRKVLVSVDVIDVNDHSPSFKENVTVLTISESVQIPTSLPLPSAVDKDTGDYSLQGYEILPKDTPFELSYSKSNTNLMLRLVKELDHETKDSYSLRIIARDGGTPQKEGILYVEIAVEDVNDNAPKFTQDNYAKVVDETIKKGSLLFTLTATDLDSGKNGQIKYRLSPQQPASILSMFSIDETLGDLRLIGDFQDAETELYTIDVEASDLADQPFTTKTTASIQVRDTINSRPKLHLSYLSTNNYSSISEYANLGVAVAHILVRDTDRGPNGVVNCKLNIEKYFELQNYDLKEYNVIVARPLDRELVPIHNLTVVCSDAGLPPLSVSESFQVKINDENDNIPEFTNKSYTVAFRENNDIDEEILTVTAQDRDDPNTDNGRFTYNLQDVSNSEFIINPITGSIKVKTSFDYELKRQINFTVVAEDKGNPRRSGKATVSVNILDENDQVPYFTQSRFNIAVSEYSRPGDLIGEIKAFDFEEGNNGQLEISIIPGTGKARKENTSNFVENKATKGVLVNEHELLDDSNLPFEVRPNGSLILLEQLDHENRTSYEFQVRVTDKGEPPLSDTATVIIGVKDENDNPPQVLHPNVSELSFTALTGSEAPATLLVLDVVDKDSGRNGFIVYTVSARNDSGRFQVDAQGNVKRTRELSGKDTGTYKLTVVVMDSGTPPLSDVRTFYIHVAGGNETADKTGLLSDQYIIITMTLVCVTILLSVTVILIIVIIKRLDNRRKNVTSCNKRPHTHKDNSGLLVDPTKIDNMKNETIDCGQGNREEKNVKDVEFGFLSSAGCVTRDALGDSTYKPNSFSRPSLPASASMEGDPDVVNQQLQPVLFQSFQQSQTVVPYHEDSVSDSSADSPTSDSGRGASDDDISATAVTLGHAGAECQQPYKTSFGHNPNPNPSAKQHSRSSQRKHVTFKDSTHALSTGKQTSASDCSSLPRNEVRLATTKSSKLLESPSQQPIITFSNSNSCVENQPRNNSAENYIRNNSNPRIEQQFTSFTGYSPVQNRPATTIQMFHS
ncbi:unnamed protein product [Candidula unifasciata]|uniref:Cadherin domain-containing protein n=1 Tax=Candidula unifasciata TaxID=100452 RepID=A0A8S4A955_9EUPU|nr:unnamed protein product [Candidula unifasciata]